MSQGDVASLADLDRLYQTVADRFGKIDVLFFNAGIAPFVPLVEATEQHFDHLFDVNVKGAYFTVQKALPYLAEGSLGCPKFLVFEPGRPRRYQRLRRHEGCGSLVRAHDVRRARFA